MPATLARYGFGTSWTDIYTDSYEGYSPNMTDYHMHDYYEISLILSGNVHVLLSNVGEHSTQPKLVLLRPYTPHYIYCEPDLLYSRRNISFSPEFIADYRPEWQKLIQVFHKNGAVMKLTEAQCRQYKDIFEKIDRDCDPFRKKLLLQYLLSLITDNISQEGEFSQIPGYVTEALAHLSTHYADRIVSGALAEQLGVGRTTLMTAFRRYTGVTVNEYLTRCRLKHAVALLHQGKTEQEVAEACGFCDACGLIRSFRRVYDMTPKQYTAAFPTAKK